jgi:DNA replication factor GINS
MIMTTIREDQDPEARNNTNSSLTIEDVYNLLVTEIQIPTLQSIPIDTYQNIATLLGDIKGQGYEGIEAKIRDRMVEMISKSVQLLLECRHQKLKEYPYEISSSASSATTTVVDYSKLTDEEKYILDGEKESDKRRNAVIAATINGRPKVMESMSAKIRAKQIVIRFIKSMEQFIGVDMTKYGPFQEEDVAVLPFENARSFIEKGIAIEIHIVR